MKSISKLLASLACLFAFAPAFAAVPPIPPTPIVAAASTQIQAPLGINMWGDSLTAGGQDGSGITVATALSGLTGQPVYNYGVGGQVSTQIMMRGGFMPTTVTVTSNSMLTSFLTQTTVTALGGVALAGTATTQSPDYRLYSTPAGNVGGTLYQGYGTLCGVYGILTRYQGGLSGGPPSTTEAYRWYSLYAPSNFSNPITCAANSTFTPDTAKLMGMPAIVWPGRNNYTQVAQVESDIAAFVAAENAIGNPNYLILGVINGEYSGEVSGQAGYTQITSINSNSGSLYPGHFWDVRAWLITQATAGNIMDQQDVANDIVPYSLRATVGTGTLSGALGTTGCPTLSATASTGTYHVDSEYIIATAVSGTSVTTCSRGQGVGGVAAAHSNGAAYTLTDNIHLSGTTDAAIASYINSHFLTLLTPAKQTVVTPAAMGNYLTGANVGIRAGSTYVHGLLNVDGNTVYAPNFGILSTDGNGNPIQILRAVGAQVYMGGSFIQQLSFGTGGVGGISAQTSANNGLWITTHGTADAGYSYSQPATGSTVTIADTGDLAIIDPAGSLSTLTVNLPTCSSSYDGKMVGASFTQPVTTLSMGATAGTVLGAPATVAANSAYRWICRGTNTTWYRLTN
jgi:hypothetical protein